MTNNISTYRGVLVAAGRVRDRTGQAGRYVVSAGAIRRAVEGGLFGGLACFVDHAEGHPSVRNLAGVWHDVVWDAERQAAVGSLRLLDSAWTQPVGALVEETLSAGEPDLGVSLVFYPLLAADGETVEEIVMVESADLVMFPASVGSRIERKVSHTEARRALRKGIAAGAGLVPAQAANGRNSHTEARKARRKGSGRLDHTKTQRSRRGVGASLVPAQVTNGEAHQSGGKMEKMTLVRNGLSHSEYGNVGGGEREGRNMQVEQGEQEQGVAGDTGRMPVPQTAWQEALAGAAVEAIVRAAGLPEVVETRLRSGQYDSPAEVETAVQKARAELAALNEAGVVQLGGRPPREIQVVDPLDRAADLVGFFFGAQGAATPPANMRSFADLYVALTGDVYFRGVFDGGRVQFAGATTATLPNLAVDAMNKVIAQQFMALDQYRWYERVTSVEPNDGRLHDMKWITLGGISDLPAVSEGDAYTELDVADVEESAAFVKRGGYVGITREMIKNSNIMQLQAIPRALATAAVRTRSAAVAALFTANSGVGPTLAQDSKALFHADHNNIDTTALGTDATAWRAARAECFQHAEVGSGKPLGIFPRFVLVPAELYDTALSILGYGEGMPTTYTPEAEGRGFADPRPVPLVVADWTDATDWAYVVDPAVYPVIQMSYSQTPGGRRHPLPELFSVVSPTSGLMFSNDILPIKVRDEFALGVNGARGIGKRNVA